MSKTNIRQHQQALETKQSKFNEADFNERMAEPMDENSGLNIPVVMPRYKFHYAPSGEWGNSKTRCGRYWTSDVAHTALIDEVTCKHCLKLL